MPSNFGESGAPVFDLKNGGVIALKYGGKNPNMAQNVNYLIPLNLAKNLLETHCNVSVPPPNVGDVLLSVSVSFVPQHAKEIDTEVAIVITRGGVTLASGEKIAAGERFTALDNYGPYLLKRAEGHPTLAKNLFQNGTVSITVTPTGVMIS